MKMPLFFYAGKQVSGTSEMYIFRTKVPERRPVAVIEKIK
jgi:hypothetical protein